MTTWSAEWTSELLDLLSGLTQLVDLEPEQADTLEAIMSGGLLTTADLGASGVRWPASAPNRRPHFGFETTRTADPPDQPTLEA